jgi:serine protease
VITLRHCSIGILAALSLSAVHLRAATHEFNPVLHHPPAEAAANVHRVLVRLRPTAAVNRVQAQAAAQPLQALAARINVSVKQSREIMSGLHALQLQPAAGESLETVLARLRADPAVAYAVPDQRRYPHAAPVVPNDSLFPGQWYLQNAQPSAIDAETAWETTTARSDIVIADVDTGVRYDHPDLDSSTVQRLLPGYDFISDAAVANDGDGRDADASDPGDWVTSADTSNPTFKGCTVSNSSWHGTRVVGILGALTNNSTGVSGITWQGKILPVRALGKCGGYDSDILDGMLWAAGIHVAGVPDNLHPAQIINLSLGGAGACTQAQQDVIDQLLINGVLVVASAGNEGGPVDSPANCKGVAGIAGLRNVGTKVGFSSLGPEVALSAPGGNCVNVNGGPCLFSLDTTSNDGLTTPGNNIYTDQNNPNLGTSFSAPIVSGIAALMKSVNGRLSPAQLIARLQEGSKPFPVSSDATIPSCHVPTSPTDTQTTECNCTTSTCGAGMANAPGAVNAALRPIAAIAVPASVIVGQNLVLQGTGSAGACGHSISTYSWSSVTSPATAIQGANTATATVLPPGSGTFTLRLTVTDDAGLQDTADVVVSTTAATTTSPSAAASSFGCPSGTGPVAVSVAPGSANVEASGGTQAFTATVSNSANTAITWEVNGVAGGNASIGTISSTGVYTAPATVPSPAVVTVEAVSAADPNQMSTAQITIVAAISVSVSPASATLQAGSGTQSFTASVQNSSNTGVTWQVNGTAGGNSTVGTITANGVYTAPAAVPAPAQVTITAVSMANTARSGSAQVTISSTAAANSGSGGGGSGGGAIDILTLIASGCALALGAGRRARQRFTD